MPWASLARSLGSLRSGFLMVAMGGNSPIQLLKIGNKPNYAVDSEAVMIH
jgi:hypothetical protein